MSTWFVAAVAAGPFAAAQLCVERGPLVDVGMRPAGLVAVDLDGDGDVDLATANRNAASVTVQRNLGSGAFANRVDLAAGGEPTWIAAGDLDTDGDTDLVVSNLNPPAVHVLENLGAGVFAPAVAFAAGPSPMSVTCADLDGDGDLDLATADEAGFVHVLERLPGGAYAAPIGLPVGLYSRSVTSADLDGDGDVDLASVSLQTNRVSILANTGGLTFAAATSFPTRVGPTFVTHADFDADGDHDLVVLGTGGTPGSHGVALHANAGGGTFLPYVGYALFDNGVPLSAAIADLDGDGDVDLAVANGWMRVLRNQGGAFTVDPAVEVEMGAKWIAAADVEGDGDADLALATDYGAITGTRTGTIEVLRNAGNGAFPPISPPRVGRTWGTAMADLDGDGDRDVVFLNPGERSVLVLANDGTGSFLSAVPYPLSVAPRAITTGDFDGDGDIDLATADGTAFSPGQVSFLRNQGAGTFAAAVTTPTGSSIPANSQPRAIASGDLDGDGDLDLAVSHDTSPSVSLLFNLGNGTFAPAVQLPSAAFGQALACADLDGDGDLDLVRANSDTLSIGVHANLGGGNFAPMVAHAVGANPIGLAVADLDGDGDLDLVAAAGGIAVLRNAGGGVFLQAVQHAAPDAMSVTPFDLDGDGDLDLVSTSPGSNALHLLANPGDASSFAVSTIAGLRGFPITCAAGDLDGDGDPDLAVACYDSNYGSILRNCRHAGSAFCAGDGMDPLVTTPCPCANSGAPGHGCANSTSASGALLSATGTTIPDTLVLQGSSMPATSPCIYLQGDLSTDVGLVFGDGVRCADGALVRLRTRTNLGGASQFPVAGDPSVSARGGVVPGSGVSRAYQTYYRSASAVFCPPATFNVTNGVRVVW